MISFSFNGPTEGDLIKMITSAAEKQIVEKANRAAAPFGGVQVRFKHKSDGSLDTVEFEGSDDAVNVARAAVTS